MFESIKKKGGERPSYDDLLKLNAQLYEMLQRDHLTGLYNMRTIYSKIDFELKRRHSRGVSCVMMDVDNFKHINDQHSHLFGSYVLAQIGRLLQHNTRLTDYAARYGGDEFLIVLTDTGPQGAMVTAQRLRQALSQKEFAYKQHRASLSASFGVASARAPSITAHELLQEADQALYKAKAQGRNTVATY